MSRRHFRALAEALKDSGASYQTVAAIARVCANENPRFDSSKFFEACGV
jgi:hypothetical protein